jgi:pimeloyl-ACP methyl ester carboxylesterase
MLIARTGAESVDWVGTSMGGLIGMLLAAEVNTPIRRLVINDAGPFIPLVALKHIGAYVGLSPVFDDLEAVEKHMREIYAPFGDLSDENWCHLARFAARTMPNNKLSLAWDPAIAQPILAGGFMVGLRPHPLSRPIAAWASFRHSAGAHGPEADCDHCRVLAPVTGRSAHMPSPRPVSAKLAALASRSGFSAGRFRRSLRFQTEKYAVAYFSVRNQLDDPPK